MGLKDKNGKEVKQNDWVVIFDSKISGQGIYGLVVLISEGYFILSPNGKIYALQEDFYKIDLNKDQENKFLNLIYDIIVY